MKLFKNIIWNFIKDLVYTGLSSAPTFRGGNKGGNANGARIILESQIGWGVNEPENLKKILQKSISIMEDFNTKAKDGRKISLADLIVLAGNAAIEKKASDAGHSIPVPFLSLRMDDTQDQTGVDPFSVLEPKGGGFRNYLNERVDSSPEVLFVESAQFLSLTVPEMTVLVRGPRRIGIIYGNSGLGFLGERPGVLSSDFFVNLLSMDTAWEPSSKQKGIYIGRDRQSGA